MIGYWTQCYLIIWRSSLRRPQSDKHSPHFLETYGAFSLFLDALCKDVAVWTQLEPKSVVTGRSYRINCFITCSTKNVIYLLHCSCGLQYMGRTKRTLNVCSTLGNTLQILEKGSVSITLKTFCYET